MWTENFQVFERYLEKPVEPEIKSPTSTGSLKKQESSRKTSTSALLTTPKPLTVWITTNCRKFWKRWEEQTTLPVSWEMCMQVKKQQLEPDMEQQTGSKLGKEYIKAVYCHPVYLTYMQSISCKMLGWMNHKLESRLWGEISTTSDTHAKSKEKLCFYGTLIFNGKKQEKLKSLLMKVREESEKAGLIFNIQKTKIMAFSPIISRQ